MTYMLIPLDSPPTNKKAAALAVRKVEELGKITTKPVYKIHCYSVG
jgi:hypothetical protein